MTVAELIAQLEKLPPEMDAHNAMYRPMFYSSGGKLDVLEDRARRGLPIESPDIPRWVTDGIKQKVANARKD